MWQGGGSIRSRGRGVWNTKALLVATCVLLLASCGDDGSGVDPGGEATGRFLDSPVEGLSYESGSYSGVTEADGSFTYKDGSAVRFAIGDIVLGDGNGKSIMTPVDLVSGARDETNPTVTNICRLVLTLDDDGNAENGGQITESVRAAATGKTVDFGQSASAFGADQGVAALDRLAHRAHQITITGASYRAQENPRRLQKAALETQTADRTRRDPAHARRATMATDAPKTSGSLTAKVDTKCRLV